VQTGSTQDRQKANTKEEDPTGLLNEGFRYRDLETGTFVTRDPASFIDGPNLYTYVHQNPWTKFDPEGLEDKKDDHVSVPIVSRSREIVTRKIDPIDIPGDTGAGYPAPKANIRPGLIALNHASDPGIRPASTTPGGAPNIHGKPVSIDVELVRKAGGSIVKSKEIIEDLEALAKEGKVSSPRVRMYLNAQAAGEGEVLVKGPVPPEAMTVGTLPAALNSVGKALTVVAAVNTAVNLTAAAQQSFQQHSAAPVVKQAAREVGGWGMALAGAKLGAALGGAAGVESGPGLFVTGLVGGIVGGIAGYYGANWVTKHF
jgi:RHS repeat-associated protein